LSQCSVADPSAELDKSFESIDPVFDFGPVLSRESLDLDSLNFLELAVLNVNKGYLEQLSNCSIDLVLLELLAQDIKFLQSFLARLAGVSLLEVVLHRLQESEHFLALGFIDIDRSADVGGLACHRARTTSATHRWWA